MGWVAVSPAPLGSRTFAIWTRQLYVTNTMARCMTISTATASGAGPWPGCKGQVATARITAIAMRKKTQRGDDVTRVTTGHAKQAITTPTMVNLA